MPRCVARIEDRQHLSAPDVIPFDYRYGIGGLGERARNRDVLIRSDDARDLDRRMDC